METEINIVEILKDKPVNTKLYSPLFSEVFFSHVSGGYIAVEHHGGTSLFLSSGRFYDYDGSEPLLFPSKEMRDGSLICKGKGNKDWLCSAPHGAGRLMSRTQAKKELSMDSYKNEMNGIYSTSVCEETIDEAPMAYKPTEEIVELIKPTVDVIDVIKPIYNFKAKL